MNWTDGPATWKQLKYLSHHGYKPDHVLTKTEASQLIRKFGGNPDALVVSQESVSVEIAEQETAHHLRMNIEAAKQALVKSGSSRNEKLQQDLVTAVAKRLEFWLDTCRGIRETFVAGKQPLDLFQKHGCRFVAPMPKQVQYILDALDSAMPAWDKAHPELFYQTLQLNFPELVRSKMKERSLVLAGAALGGLAGYYAFFWIARQGFYGIILPGALLGFGAGLFPNRSLGICFICGILAFALGLFTEWRFAPFDKDHSLLFFLLHVHNLRPVTLVMILASAAIGFYGPFRQGKTAKQPKQAS